MNRIHRTVWNHRRNAVMVVAENAGSGGKRSGTTGALLASVLTGVMLGGAAQAADLAATALPSGPWYGRQAPSDKAGRRLTVTKPGQGGLEGIVFSTEDAKVNLVQRMPPPSAQQDKAMKAP